MSLANLLDHPTHKIEERKRILERVYFALLEDPNAITAFKGGFCPEGHDEAANWAARETVAALLRSYL